MPPENAWIYAEFALSKPVAVQYCIAGVRLRMGATRKLASVLVDDDLLNPAFAFDTFPDR